jgi:hypothetical protein
MTIQATSPITIYARRQLRFEIRKVAKGAIMRGPNPPPELAIPIAKPRLLLNHLDTVDIITTNMALVPMENRKPYVIYNCHAELVWLVNSKLRPENNPIIRITILGPYLSNAQPPNTANALANIIETEKTPEVTALVNSNSLSMDLKKTVNDERVPIVIVPIIPRAITVTQP